MVDPKKNGKGSNHHLFWKRFYFSALSMKEIIAMKWGKPNAINHPIYQPWWERTWSPSSALRSVHRKCLLAVSRPRYVARESINIHTKWQTFRIKVLRLPQKRMQLIFWKTLQKSCACRTKWPFDTFSDTWECHEVPCLPHETRLRNVWNIQKLPLLQQSPIGTAMATSSRTVANGLRTWKRPRTNTSQLPDSQSKTRTLRYVFGKKLLILFRFETRSRSMMQLKIDFSSNMVTIRDAQWSCSYVLSVPQEVMAEA